MSETYHPYHCSNHIPTLNQHHIEGRKYRLSRIAEWIATLDYLRVTGGSEERIAYHQTLINGHAYALLEHDRALAADLAYQIHVQEHWSWSQAPYDAYRSIIER